MCDLLPSLQIQTHVHVVAHRREITKPTSTALLALEILEPSTLHVHGHQDAPVDFTALASSGETAWLLYPDDDAVSVCDVEPQGGPRHLIVPDGSWRQASKMARRIPGLEGIPKVSLPDHLRTRWGVRREPKAGGLATFEAIAHALAHLESPDLARAMMRVFDEHTQRTLWARQPTGPHPPGTSTPR